MRKRISLREFQQNLVKRLAEAKTGGEFGLLGVQAGDENWLIELADAGTILTVPPISSVPLTRHWYRGIINFRGTLYGVVDFSAFNGGEPALLTDQARLLLIGTRYGIQSALLVSQIVGLKNRDDFTLGETESDEAPPPWVGQRLRDTRDEPWASLDVAHLLTCMEFLNAEAI